MKLIALGDIHGRSIWKDIVNLEKDANKIVFIGDYFDSHNSGYSGNRQIENFKDIIAFKEANPDKVITLTGNHDYHYIRGIGETYSGYQGGYALEIGEFGNQPAKLVCKFYIEDKLGETKEICENIDQIPTQLRFLLSGNT